MLKITCHSLAMCGVMMMTNQLPLSAEESPSSPQSSPQSVSPTSTSAESGELKSASTQIKSSTDLFEFQLVASELHGQTESVLKTQGFTQTQSGMLRKKLNLLNPQVLDHQSSPPVKALVDSLSDLLEVKVRSRPTIKMAGGAEAGIILSGRTVLAPPDSESTYQVQSHSEIVHHNQVVETPSTEITIKQARMNGARRCEVLLEIALTDLDGRTPISGLNTDIGQPILTRRTWETTVHLTLDQEAEAISIPLQDHNHLLVVMELAGFKRESTINSVGTSSSETIQAPSEPVAP